MLIDRKLGISAIVASAAPFERLQKTLQSLAAQNRLPDEVVICRKDLTASEISEIHRLIGDSDINLKVFAAEELGAAVQREAALEKSSHEYLLFMDDDIDMRAGCVQALANVLDQDIHVGGVCACIENQNYQPPGAVYRFLLGFLGFPKHGSLSGLCRGPILHFLPDLNDLDGSTQSMEWLNLTCTMYRASNVPIPLFEGIIGRYSLMEDVALSLKVRISALLAASRDAKIYHDTKPANYKSKSALRQKMEVFNRRYILKHIEQRFGFTERVQFIALAAIFSISVINISGSFGNKVSHIFYRWFYTLIAVIKW